MELINNGLRTDTSDLHYFLNKPYHFDENTPALGGTMLTEYTIPSWSTDALMEIIPSGIRLSNGIIADLKILVNRDNGYFTICYKEGTSTYIKSDEHKNLFYCAYETVNNLLNANYQL